MKFVIRIFNTVCDWMFDDLCEKMNKGEIDVSIVQTICGTYLK